MSKQLSQREQDLQRRSRASDGDGTAGSRSKFIWGGAAAVAIALIVWAAWPDGPAADSRAANFSAFGLADDPFLGDADAPIVLVGYESPHCSNCKVFHQQTLPQLQAEFFDTGAVVYYYIQGTIGGDLTSNIAQECAYKYGGNGAFWEITDRFYQRSYTYNVPSDLDQWLRDAAVNHDFDGDAAVACLDGKDTTSKVSADWEVGSDFGARGTPTFWAFGPEGEALKLSSSQVQGTLRDMVSQA